jgi:hypothetical protein
MDQPNDRDGDSKTTLGLGNDNQNQRDGDSITTLGLGNKIQSSTEVPTPSTEVIPVEDVTAEEVPVTAEEGPVVAPFADNIPTTSVMTEVSGSKKTRKKRKRESTSSSSASSKTLSGKINKLERDLKRLTKRVDIMQKRMPRCNIK